MTISDQDHSGELAALSAAAEGPTDPDEEISYGDEEGEDAVEWKQLPPEREFFASPYDPPVKTLVQEMADKELIVRPSFQRYGVWDTVRRSKFIESILLNIPIPTLFFAEDDDKSMVVVDGQQRLLALKEFLENRYTLKNLEVLWGLKGKRFEDLTDRQQKIIRNRTLRCLVISAKSDSEIRFQVFERLNQGGVPLNAQEVRHCVYRGSLNDLLHALVKDPVWLRMMNLKEPHRRMNDCELVLRFLAIREALPNYSPPLKTLLNEFMRDHRTESAAGLETLAQAFRNAMGVVLEAFGSLAFRRFFMHEGDLKIDRALNRAVFDSQMLVMEGMDVAWVRENNKAIVAKYVELCLSDQKFSDSLSRATADRTRLDYRLIKWKDALNELGATLPAEVRLP